MELVPIRRKAVYIDLPEIKRIKPLNQEFYKIALCPIRKPKLYQQLHCLNSVHSTRCSLFNVAHNINLSAQPVILGYKKMEQSQIGVCCCRPSSCHRSHRCVEAPREFISPDDTCQYPSAAKIPLVKSHWA